MLLFLSFFLIQSSVENPSSMEERKNETVSPEYINFTVVDINPESGYTEVRADIKLPKYFNRTEIEVMSPSRSVESYITRPPSNRDNTITKYYDRISFSYKILINRGNMDRNHRYIGHKYAFFTWPDIKGEVSIGEKTYGIEYNRSVINPAVVDSLTDKSGDSLYENSSIVSDGNTALISNRATEDMKKRIDFRTYNSGRINYSIYDSRTHKEADVLKLLENSEYLFNNSDKSYTNSLFILSSTPTYYDGGAFDRDLEHSVIWSDEFAVSEEVHTILGHELFHSSQIYYVGDKMEWWIEGSANYVGGMIENVSYNNITRTDILSSSFEKSSWDYHDSENQTSKLINPKSWEMGFDYIQGARFVHIIDRHIRKNTDKNVLDLHYWMQSENRVNYSDFKSKVREWTSDEFADEINNYVTKSKPISKNTCVFLLKNQSKVC